MADFTHAHGPLISGGLQGKQRTQRKSDVFNSSTQIMYCRCTRGVKRQPWNKLYVYITIYIYIMGTQKLQEVAGNRKLIVEQPEQSEEGQGL